MTDSAFAADAAVVRNALASDLGCDESAFATNDLTVVPRPADSRERQYAALAATLGTGTVLSVDPPFLDWARANRPAAHHHVLYPAFLAALAGEIAVAERARRRMDRPLVTCSPDPPQ